MNIKIDISEITDMIDSNELEQDAVEIMEETMLDIYTDLTAPPPLGTPVDTGEARNSWKLDLSNPLQPEVYSDSPYMNRLNDGLSSQTPPGFVDAISDKHTRK